MDLLFDARVHDGSLKIAKIRSSNGSILVRDEQYIAMYVPITEYLLDEAKKPTAKGGGGMGAARKDKVRDWLKTKWEKRGGTAKPSWTRRKGADDKTTDGFKLTILKELVPEK